MEVSLLLRTGGAQIELTSFWKPSLAALVPASENAELVGIDGFEIIALATGLTFDFSVVGSQDNQELCLPHQSLLNIHQFIMEFTHEEAPE